MLNSPDKQAPTSGDARDGQQKGFTLLEVVVATAIAGLAMAGLFKAGTVGVFAGTTASRVEEAVERAQSHLAAFGREGAVVASELEGEDGGDYHWHLRAVPLAREQLAASGDAPSISLFDVQVLISWRALGRNRSVVLTSRRIGTVAVP